MNTNIFFEDIRRTYEDARKALSDKPERGDYRAEPKFHYVKASNRSTVDNPAEALALAAFFRNVKGYDIAISTEHLTFDLRVLSAPVGAKIFYRRASDDQESEVGPPTDYTIRNLPRATYYFRCHLKDHDDQRQTFDAVIDPSPSIIFRFDGDSK